MAMHCAFCETLETLAREQVDERYGLTSTEKREWNIRHAMRHMAERLAELIKADESANPKK